MFRDLRGLTATSAVSQQGTSSALAAAMTRPAHVDLGAHDDVGLVGGLALLLAAVLPVALHRESAQQDGLAAHLKHGLNQCRSGMQGANRLQRIEARSCWVAADFGSGGSRPGADGGRAGRVLRVLCVEQIRQHGHAAAAWGSSQSQDGHRIRRHLKDSQH